MKILWFCNMPIPKIAEKLSLPEINLGGWLIGLTNYLSSLSEVELNIAFTLVGCPLQKLYLKLNFT